MRLRAYLLLAGFGAQALLLVCLFVLYSQMLLSLAQLLWLVAATIGAAVLSTGMFFLLTRPIESSVRALTRETTRLAEGDFGASVPLAGPREFQQLAERFNEMARRLDASFRQIRDSEKSRRELVANISHDLRTPLASVQSFVEALQDDIIQDRDTFLRYLATIRLETGRLGSMIEDLFQLSRLESGAFAFDPEPVHPEDVIVESLAGLRMALDQKEIEVRVEMPDHVPQVSAMPLEIKRVFTNIVQNAVRHSPERSTLRIRVEREGDELRFSVRDQGPGISPEDQAKIFERFYRADPSRTRSSGGSGLGLAIARTIVAQHKGRIGVISEPGRGSEFWFTLPVVLMLS